MGHQYFNNFKSQKGGTEMKVLMAGMIAFAFFLILTTKNDIQERNQWDAAANIKKRHASMPARGKQQEKFAVLISGDSEERHVQNLSSAYHLVIDLGYKPQNIYVLDDYKKKAVSYPVDGQPTKEALWVIFNYLKGRARSGDLLFIYTTGHGSSIQTLTGRTHRKKEQSILTFKLDSVTEEEFYSLVKDIRANAVFLFDQCNGGGFAKKMLEFKNRFAALAASQENELSRGNAFPLLFFFAFRSRLADNDNDGRIDVREAYDFTVRQIAIDNKNKEQEQNPLFVSNVSKIYLE